MRVKGEWIHITLEVSESLQHPVLIWLAIAALDCCRNVYPLQRSFRETQCTKAEHKNSVSSKKTIQKVAKESYRTSKRDFLLKVLKLQHSVVEYLILIGQ